MDLLASRRHVGYHRARSLTGKLSQVISGSRSAIAKERNESARNTRVEKQKHPLVYYAYMESNKRMLTYRNVRRRAEERVCAREAREKRQGA
jgi:hypothetical protein